jgi:glycosyltransferase involved in cell wall biosynthesis
MSTATQFSPTKSNCSESPRVVVVSDQFPPAKGGIGDYTLLLVNNLADRGVRVSLVVPTGSGHPMCRAPIAATFERWSWSAARIVHRALEDAGADWLHLQHNGGMYASCRLAAYFLPRYLRWRRWKGGIAVTFHDINRPPLFPKAGVLRHWTVRELARSADVAIAADTSDVETLHSWGANVRQIPIGSNVPISTLSAADAFTIRSEYRIPHDAVLVGHFGTALGLDTLFEAVARLPQTILLLVGKTAAAGRQGEINILPDALHAKIEKLGIHSRVRWTCHLPEAAVADALAACDVLVLPYPTGASMRHGGLLACLSQGKPVVTTSPRREIPGFTPGQTYLAVPAGDADALVRSLSGVLGDPSFAARLAIGAAEARALFSWERISTLHLDSYACRSAKHSTASRRG